MKKIFLLMLVFASPLAFAKAKPKHPFDLFDHPMHTEFFEGVGVECDTCHADPESFEKREKVNRLGCHICHKRTDGPLQATSDCKLCHIGGKFPKPISHSAGWMAKHETFAKENPKECAECHQDAMFCMNCHKRRDSIQETMHRRNFKFFHSIEARANPRKCDACHRVDFCQECHSGRENSNL